MSKSLGVLTKSPRKGFSVKGLSDEKVFDLYVIIGALDGLAAELACDNLTQEIINEMEFYTMSMDLAINTANFSMYYKQQLLFHKLYIDQCGNELLIEKLMALKQKLLKNNYEIEDEERKKAILLTTNSQHKAMLKLFKSKDKVKLRQYVEKPTGTQRKPHGNHFRNTKAPLYKGALLYMNLLVFFSNIINASVSQSIDNIIHFSNIYEILI